jgi:hypothetical protein
MQPKRPKTVHFATTLAFFLIAAAQAPAVVSGTFSGPLDLLGIQRFECRCSQTLEAGSDAWLWLFVSEPTIGAVDPEGPSHGILQADDVIVAVDGWLITTRTGGERFSRISAGETVELTIRRDGVELRERVVAEAPEKLGEEPELERQAANMTIRLAELSEALAELARLAPELAERSELAELAELSELPEPVLSQLSDPSKLEELSRLEGLSELEGLSALAGLEIDTRPLGWFGIGLSFSGSMLQRSATDQLPRWHFDAPPKVHSLDSDGPAKRAGIRRGDVLTAIDGIPLDTEAGGERFSEIRPGQTVNWTVRRRSATLTIPITAEERPE